MLEEAKHWLWICLFLGLLASGTSRYRYERPSRVVEIKQGRLQGTLVEVPLVSPYSSAGADKNQVCLSPQPEPSSSNKLLCENWIIFSSFRL